MGDNRTSGADGDARVIGTAHLSGEIAEQVGFVVRESITLDAWPRFGLHHANGINAETAVWLVAS